MQRHLASLNANRIQREFDLTAVQGHSKVIDLGVNGKPMCDFILVINSNFSRICYRLRYSQLRIENC